jgi:hypothetical protein
MRRPVGSVIVVAAVAFVLGAAGPASAASVGFSDARGDAEPRYDITRVVASNGEQRLTVRARVPRLQGRGTQILAVHLQSGASTYSLHSVRRSSGRVVTRLTSWDGVEQSQARCGSRATWRIARGVVRVVIPQRCLDRRGPVRLSVLTGAGDGTAGDPADWTRTVRVPFG